MDYLDYFKKINAQKQINKLARKHKNKKIVIYGAGIMAEILFNYFDLSKLNIVAVCDKKFEEVKNTCFHGYNTIGLSQLRENPYDVILVLLLKDNEVVQQLKDVDLINTINENSIIKTMFYIPLIEYLKALL